MHLKHPYMLNMHRLNAISEHKKEFLGSDTLIRQVESTLFPFVAQDRNKIPHALDAELKPFMLANPQEYKHAQVAPNSVFSEAHQHLGEVLASKYNVGVALVQTRLFEEMAKRKQMMFAGDTYRAFFFHPEWMHERRQQGPVY